MYICICEEFNYSCPIQGTMFLLESLGYQVKIPVPGVVFFPWVVIGVVSEKLKNYMPVPLFLGVH